MVKQNPHKRLIAFLGSPKFFWGILAFFILQAAWIACTGRYPMAFDEDFHLGIIRLYAHHASPFWAAQPQGADAFGAVFRDPSYLYHWLMSFPYRLISAFTHDQTVQVLWLRAINIGFFAAGLALYRRALLKTRASGTIVNGCLLIFTLIPVVPLLAAQINYDNLFLPLVALVLLQVIGFNEKLIREKRIPAGAATGILILCLLTSLVKYAFLPIFIAIILYLLIRVRQVFGSWRKVWLAKLMALKQLGSHTGVLLIIGFMLASGLFIQRYGVNIVRYHNPVAECSKALSVEACNHYGPWLRDHNLELNKSPAAAKSPLTFAADWFYGMWLRMFFAVGGPDTSFQTRGPLVIPAVSAIVFACSGVVLSLVYARRLFRRYDGAVLGLFLLVAAVYTGVLWLDGYRAFLRTGMAVAINGRYLFPVLLPLLLIGALAINEFCRRRQDLKLLIGGTAVLTMLWGGGALTYILRSSPGWYWPDQGVKTVNQKVQNTLGPITPGYRDPITFMHRR